MAKSNSKVECVCRHCNKSFVIPRYRFNSGRGTYCSKECSAFGHRIDPQTKFWNNVNKTETCWLWTGAKIRGYGSIGVYGKTTFAHRFSYEMVHGPIPPDMCVCHRCDTPLCVRPDHLFVGTIGDNNRDMFTKGRAADRTGVPLLAVRGENHWTKREPEKLAIGERHGQAKLTVEKVIELRKLRQQGTPLAALATRFGVCEYVVWCAAVGRTWKHVPLS